VTSVGVVWESRGMENPDSIAALTADIREFARERDWEQFHDPKSLILALVGEVGELAELFQWVPAGDAVGAFADPARKQRAGEEISDVLIYLLRLADVLGVEAGPAAEAKLADSRMRFPATTVSGQAPEKG
jgi:dCTP diphosphatase